MKGYGQFCPIAVACETFAERWTPLILRELLAGARRFNEIRRGLPLISRTLLGQRLRELEDAGVVKSRPRVRGRGREYGPTAAAEEFRAVLERLGEWGQRWGTTQFDPENLDLMLLMWNVRRRVDLERLPARRVVVRFDFRAFPARCRGFRTCWLILERTGTDVCLKDPGFDVDLVVTADAAAIAQVWTGAITFAQAVRSGGLRLEGPRELVRAFPTWLLLSHFAHVERPARTGTKTAFEAGRSSNGRSSGKARDAARSGRFGARVRWRRSVLLRRRQEREQVIEGGPTAPSETFPRR